MYCTYFSNQEWSDYDAVELVAIRHELTDNSKIEILGFIQEAHGVILEYNITC